MKKTIRIISWGLVGVLVFCLVGLAGLTVCDAGRIGRLQKRSGRVSIGDSKDQVKQIMGEPNASWDRQKAFMTNREMPPGFAYGKSMDWGNAFHSDFPFFFPFRIRLFGPDADDIVVEFDDKWIVTEIRHPK
jgi:hypothetical protein